MDKKEAIREYRRMPVPQDLGEALTYYSGFHNLVSNTPPYILSVNGIPALPKPEMDSFIGQLHGAIGLAGEAPEILEHYKKRMFGKHEKINIADVIKEMGDSVFYLEQLRKSLPGNVTWRDILVVNMDKLTERYGQ